MCTIWESDRSSAGQAWAALLYTLVLCVGHLDGWLVFAYKL